MINLTGWTWEYIDAHMTFPRLYAMHRSWKSVPPPAIQMMRIAAFLGVESPKDAEPEKVGTIEDFINAMGGLNV